MFVTILSVIVIAGMAFYTWFLVWLSGFGV
jgi:hypothetical protein